MTDRKPPPAGEEAPPESGWVKRDATRSVSMDQSPPQRSSAFEARKQVLITLVQTDRPQGDRLRELGCGRLLDPLAIGRPLRIAVDGKPAFVTTEVRGVKRLGRDSVEVVTTHSVYRLERVLVSVPSEPTDGRSPQAGEGKAAPVERAPALAVTGPAEPTLTGTPIAPGGLEVPLEDSTSFRPVEDLPALDKGPFRSRTRVRISRIKSRDPASEKIGDLGPGRVLDHLEVGDSVRLSLDSGQTFATSAVRALRYLGKSIVEIETKNTIYRLQKIDPS